MIYANCLGRRAGVLIAIGLGSIAKGAYAGLAEEANKLCEPIPYTVGEAVAGGEVAARFGKGAIRGLRKLPSIEGVAGTQVVNYAYAGMVNQAMESVLQAYACRIKKFLALANVEDAEAKLASVDAAVAELTTHMVDIQNAAVQPGGYERLVKIREDFRKRRVREPGEPTIDRGILQRALEPYDSNKLFINNKQREFWATLKVGAAAEVGACGGIIEAALSDGGSSLQKSLSAVQSILVNYLDPKIAPSVALASLYGNVAVVPVGAATTKVGTFQGCTSGLGIPTSSPSLPATPASAVVPEAAVFSSSSPQSN